MTRGIRLWYNAYSVTITTEDHTMHRIADELAGHLAAVDSCSVRQLQNRVLDQCTNLDGQNTATGPDGYTEEAPLDGYWLGMLDGELWIGRDTTPGRVSRTSLEEENAQLRATLRDCITPPSDYDTRKHYAHELSARLASINDTAAAALRG